MVHQLIENYKKLNCIKWWRVSRETLGPLLKTGLSLIGNVLKPLARSVLIPLGLTAAAAARDATIHK